MVGIGRSVGAAGTNDREDVKLVQRLLNRKRPRGVPALRVDGIPDRSRKQR